MANRGRYKCVKSAPAAASATAIAGRAKGGARPQKPCAEGAARLPERAGYGSVAEG